MIRRLFAALTVVLAMGAIGPIRAQKPDPAVVMLEAARQKETLDGDLHGAIKQYQAIVSTYGKTNRAVAATALVRMAECYQKLGDVEAHKIYERLVRDYADQKDALLVARARLASTGSGGNTQGDRAVWTGPKVSPYGRVSSDGRFITARDNSNGGLMVHDVLANVDRLLTPPAVPYYAQWTRHAVFSRDGKRIVYEWWDQNNNSHLEFRIATVTDSSFVEPRRIFSGSDDIPPGELAAFDWSPDGRWIAAAVRRKDRTGQIVVITVADGSMKVLKSMDWNVPDEMFFSNDGRYIAYDRPASDTSAQHDLFVLAIDGSREILAVAHAANDRVMGWSPDGTQLLFSSDRTGSWGLWGARFADGKVQGSPQLLKSNIGNSFEGKTLSLGVTAAGALYVHKRLSTRDIAIASIDLEADKPLGAPVTFTQGPVGGARNPVWSPDGAHLAYPCDDGTNLATRSVATGEVRFLPRRLNYVQAVLQWSPDGRSLLIRGTDLKGRTGIFQIDVQTGEPTPVRVGDGPDFVGFAQWSADNKKVYFSRAQSFVERDLASGSEREVVRGVGGMGPLSPDGQYLTARHQPSTDTTRLMIVPVSGGPARELLRLTVPEKLIGRREGREVWTPDSKSVIFIRDTGSRWELWLAPVAGGRPRKLDVDLDVLKDGTVEDQGFSLSPDGRRIAFVTGKTADEVWSLENFLPAQAASGRGMKK